MDDQEETNTTADAPAPDAKKASAADVAKCACGKPVHSDTPNQCWDCAHRA